jgi:hypothetical protein
MTDSINDIAIIGGGGLGKETAVLIHQINQLALTWNVVGFYDDAMPVGQRVAGHLVLGKVDELNKINYPLHVVVAIGDPWGKKESRSTAIKSATSFSGTHSPFSNDGIKYPARRGLHGNSGLSSHG